MFFISFPVANPMSYLTPAVRAVLRVFNSLVALKTILSPRFAAPEIEETLFPKEMRASSTAQLC